MPAFIGQALRGEPLTVFGKGQQTRSFCYSAISSTASTVSRRSDFHEPVNIGNPTEFTILDFAKLIIKLTGSKSQIIYEPLPVDDPKQRRPDISRAKKLLGWEPKMDLEDGLRQTIEFFKNRV